MGDELHYKELNDQNRMHRDVFFGRSFDVSVEVQKTRISIPNLATAKNENPPKFSTKGDCHVYSWL